MILVNAFKFESSFNIGCPLKIWTENLKNKAGYTANTSRGRVGRGGDACFPTFWLERDGPTDGWTKALIELRVRN